MPRARDDHFDDDEYYPQEGRPARGFPFILVGGLLLGLLVLGGLVFSMRARTYRVAEQQAAATVRAEAAVAESRAAQAGPYGMNWKRAIGTWQREMKGKEDIEYPHRFEFRSDGTARVARGRLDGGVLAEECRVEVFIDHHEDLSLRLFIPMGLYSYRFHFRPDGTLLLEDGAAGLVFTRAN